MVLKQKKMIPITKPYMTREDARAASEVILSRWLTQGPKVELFEKAFATYVNAKYAVAVSNCTTALHLALIVAGIGPGDEVICPSLSFIATANPIRYVGAIPVFADVDADTYNLDPHSVESSITRKTRAIMVVHQLGMPADISAFKQIANKHKLLIIEDAAAAAGSMFKGKKIGSHSDLVCFSFHPRKIITTGEGGMITTSNKKYYERLKRLRQHGMSINDLTRHRSKTLMFEDYIEIGYNYRMSDIQAAVGITQLKKIDWLIKKRRQIVHAYNKAFREINCLHTPYEPPQYFSNFQTYMIYLRKNCPITRMSLMKQLHTLGISTRNGITAIHKTLVYKDYNKLHLPITEEISNQGITLPLFPEMTSQDTQRVIVALTTLLTKKNK